MGERTRKTPEQKAQERLDIETRRVTVLEGKKKNLETELATVKTELEAAVRRRDYAASNPALPPTPQDVPSDPDGAAMVGPVCPECAQGKHQNCTEEVPDPSGDEDAMTTCRCADIGHVAA